MERTVETAETAETVETAATTVATVEQPGPSSFAVSVVVAVYNPGPHLERLLGSLTAQTMPADQLELVFVDDGSTDDSLERLRAFARGRPGTVVETIPNSGWPGRPRNIGLDLSHGEYVFFADHDDEFFPEALERMHAAGRRDTADVVCPKLVTEGSHTPFWELAGRNLSHGRLVEDQLLIWRMTHKLFRREFLLEHSIRFPEGPAPLEDHLFMAPLLPRARSISLIADYPCYTWVLRRDGTNNSDELFRAPGYWENFRTSLHLFGEAAGPGPVADAGLVWAAARMLHPVRPRGYLELDAAARREAVAPIAALAKEEVPPRVDPRVSVLKRLRVQALRADDLATFDRLQELVAALDVDVRLDRAEWVGGRLELSATATLAWPGEFDVRLTPAGETAALDLSAWDTGIGPRAVLTPSDLGRLELTVRHRKLAVEWPLDGEGEAHLQPGADGERLAATWTGVLDPAHGRFGQGLDDGLWDVLVRVQFLGESRVHRLVAPAAPTASSSTSPADGPRASAELTGRGTLAVRVGDAEPARPHVVAARWSGPLLELTLAGAAPEGARVLARRRGDDHDLHEGPVDGTTARAELPTTAPGDLVDLWLRPQPGSPEQRLVHDLGADRGPAPGEDAPYELYRTQHGSLSLRHVAPAGRPGWRGVARRLRSALR